MDDKLLQLYFEGRTTDEQSCAITAWLEADEANMKHYQQMCRLYELCFWQEEPQTVATTLKEKLGRRNIWWEVCKVAAVFLLGFALNYLMNPSGHQEKAVMQTIHVPAGQNAWLTLADSSKVWINAGSTLTFPNCFTKSARRVYLEGEAYFEVQANKEKPFIVSTKLYDIKALGTAFNVNAYKQSKGFETALIRGKVEISDKITNHIVTLTPNNRAVLVDNELSVVPIENTNYFLWREGIIYFDEPMAVVLKKLELYFDVNIQINNKSVLQNKRTCTGKFRTRDGLDHILQVLQLTGHFTYHKNDEENTVTIN